MLKTKEVYSVSTDFEPRDWRFSLIDYALHDILPDDPKEVASIRRRSLHFYYDPIVKTLYRHSYDGILLHCLSNSEAQKVLKEAHDAYVELISQVKSSRIDCTCLHIIGRP